MAGRAAAGAAEHRVGARALERAGWVWAGPTRSGGHDGAEIGRSTLRWLLPRYASRRPTATRGSLAAVLLSEPAIRPRGHRTDICGIPGTSDPRNHADSAYPRPQVRRIRDSNPCLGRSPFRSLFAGSSLS